jgi:hypothetical protein
LETRLIIADLDSLGFYSILFINYFVIKTLLKILCVIKSSTSVSVEWERVESTFMSELFTKIETSRSSIYSKISSKFEGKLKSY